MIGGEKSAEAGPTSTKYRVPSIPPAPSYILLDDPIAPLYDKLKTSPAPLIPSSLMKTEVIPVLRAGAD